MSFPLLNAAQARVLGSLIEKQYTVPASYPMTPNGVKVACNQKSNRDPVVDYDEDTVFDTLKALEKLGYTESGLWDGTQTIKYRHRLNVALDFGRQEVSLLCELLNRGSQTAAELRVRCERLCSFADRSEVEAVLGRLADRGFVVQLDRQPGAKENRWSHLFFGKPVPAAPAPPAAAAAGTDRIGSLEDRVRALEERLAALEDRR